MAFLPKQLLLFWENQRWLLLSGLCSSWGSCGGVKSDGRLWEAPPRWHLWSSGGLARGVSVASSATFWQRLRILIRRRSPFAKHSASVFWDLASRNLSKLKLLLLFRHRARPEGHRKSQFYKHVKLIIFKSLKVLYLDFNDYFIALYFMHILKVCVNIIFFFVMLY